MSQPKALFLADVIKADPASKTHHDDTAAELRRLHAVNQELLGALKDTLELLEVYCGDFEEATRNQARAAIAKAEGGQI
jgi:hypothetical protein